MGVPDFPITEAQITGLFVESVLFGIHLLTFAYCVRALTSTPTRWRAPSEINWAMLVVSVVLLANAGFDVVLGYYHNLKAFVFFKGEPGDFDGISNWINVSKSLTVVIQTMIGDAMLIYRCWIIHNCSFLVVALPILLWLGCFASTIWVITLEATLHSNALVVAKQLQPAGTSFWALTISLNIITTGLLLWKIWSVDRSNRRYTGTFDGAGGSGTTRKSKKGSHTVLRNVMRIIVESGLLYSTTALITFITFITQSSGVYVITDAEIQIVGIAFNMIIIRAAILAGQENAGTTMGRSTRSVPLQIVHPGITSTMGTTELNTTTSMNTNTNMNSKMEVHVLTTQYSTDNFSKTERGGDEESQIRDDDKESL
ncbi:hypothetical protein D9613_001288 [Agrocybe pediades]|uniref:Uncharacterized protein n=1 Tax=Agrocybe pediades TaxID=84607 RepID=A0A8H4VVK0_9AGAR|nr:hypothetical protein D9613_001288 [Agrocybe pediades]KAF9552274.1 hypothetical protein CPC08DRAFT_714750 [Agrocybe pediades]